MGSKGRVSEDRWRKKRKGRERQRVSMSGIEAHRLVFTIGFSHG